MTLTVYVDRSPRCELAQQHLIAQGVPFILTKVYESEAAAAFLIEQRRPPAKFPLPQFYIGNTLVWENGFKDMSSLTAAQINQRIEEINATFN